MEKKDYTVLDGKIIALVEAGKTSFGSMLASLSILASEFANENTDTFRVVDRRLQALRKKGRIEYDSKKGWCIRLPDVSRKP